MVPGCLFDQCIIRYISTNIPVSGFLCMDLFQPDGVHDLSPKLRSQICWTFILAQTIQIGLNEALSAHNL